MDQKESDDFARDMQWRGAVIKETMDCYQKRTMSFADVQQTMTNVIASIVSKQGDLATLADYDSADPPAGRASVTEGGAPIYYNRRKASDPVQYSPPPAQAPGNVGA